MGHIAFPLLIFAFFSGILALQMNDVDQYAPATQSISENTEGEYFVNYAHAVAIYLKSNPTFIGSVSNTSLISTGLTLPLDFLNKSNNTVSQIGSGSGRRITCYSNIGDRGVNEALRLTDNDASFGKSLGSSWVPSAPGLNSTPQLLDVPVPAGYAVSVINIGS